MRMFMVKEELFAARCARKGVGRGEKLKSQGGKMSVKV